MTTAVPLGVEKSKQRKQIEAAIRDVLMNNWDPIGIKNEPACRDEYDSYIGTVYRLLTSRASTEQIAAHLANVQTTMMGLLAPANQCLPVAEKLAAVGVQLSAPSDGRA